MPEQNCAPCRPRSPVVTRAAGNRDGGVPPQGPAGLRGFERPRFFANQLLTEDDLRRLDDYIIGKQSLHNRHFHDWGVVCGLMVSCAGCGTGDVIVSPGHALTAMGEDIIVATPERVDVCALLGHATEPASPCPDPADAKGERAYLLSIHYQETLVDGRVGHRRCSCGSSCGCAASAPGQPSVTCEGHRFELTEIEPDPIGRDPGSQGFMAAVIDCLQPLIDRLASLTSTSGHGTPHQQALEMVQRLKWLLAEMVPIAAEIECNAEQQLHEIVVPGAVPDSGDPQALAAFETALAQAYLALLELAAVVFQACLCRAAMPPCRPFEPGGVPLAVVTTRRGECSVTRVCNWGNRKLAHTLPNLEYWIAPALDPLADLLAELCCTRLSFGGSGTTEHRAKLTDMPFMTSGAPVERFSAGMSALRRALPRPVLERVSAAEMEAIATAVIGASTDRRRDPPAALIQQLSRLAVERVRGKAGAPPRSDEEVAALRRELDSLRERISALERE